jgi:hypothetical protein
MGTGMRRHGYQSLAIFIVNLTLAVLPVKGLIQVKLSACTGF